MRKPQDPINDHRLARLRLWAMAVLVWTASALLTVQRPNRRHMRQRHSLLFIDKLTRMTRNLLLIRAARYCKHYPAKHWRARPRPGFRRRTEPRSLLRSIAGARLRRFLQHGSAAERMTRLIDIVRNLDLYVRRFMLRRARNGITRLLATRIVRPSQDAAHSLASPAPLAADSS